MTKKLPQIYTANHANFPIRIRKITGHICGNFWVFLVTREREHRIYSKRGREREMTEDYEIVKDTHKGKDSMRHNERGKERDNDG